MAIRAMRVGVATALLFAALVGGDVANASQDTNNSGGMRRLSSQALVQRSADEPLSLMFVGVQSGKCIDVEGFRQDDGANIWQWDCAFPKPTRNQVWKAIPLDDGYYELRALHSDRCMDVEGIRTDNGANIWQWQCKGTPNQRWMLRPLTNGVDGRYELVAKHSRKCADVQGFGTSNGGDIFQWQCNKTDNQYWDVYTVEPDSVGAM